MTTNDIVKVQLNDESIPVRDMGHVQQHIHQYRFVVFRRTATPLN